VTEPAALEAFDPRVAAWFRARHGSPTDVQERAWPRIAAGEHVLATAPTGSGKTLCAFLVPLERLLTGAWSPGTVRVLYVSPLKALNNDVQRNLLQPLAELREHFRAEGGEAPEVRVDVRSGDSSPEDRRRMQRRPPEILVTTPESLNILLTSAGGRSMLGGVRMVILDEIHAVAAGRRGLWLMHGVEALTELSGEVQRVALSATVRPLDAVAALVGGHATAPDGAPEARPRPVRIVTSEARKQLELEVRALEPDELPGDGGLDAIGPVAREIAAASTRNRSTLVFTNSRALCEKLAMRVNQDGDADAPPLAWAHHGSLSREIRHEVEARLKAGELRTIVATSSLELGIDIGDLDEVLMVQAPPSVAAAVQRAGRAGHGVGEVSRAVLHPTHPRDALECTVLARAALAGDIEPTRIPGPALDVLAQMIVVRLAMAPRSAAALYDAVRTVAPYRNLDRALFDPVLAMLKGRYRETRLPDLAPRLLEDPDRDELQLRRGTLLALYGSGGMIPDRGYYQLRHADSGVRIGELDEEFVWENGPGRTFSMGSQQWRVQRVTHSDVFVTPAPNAAFAPPFWRSEDRNRDAHLSQRIGEFLRDADALLEDGGADALTDELENAPLDAPARQLVVEHLLRQRAHTQAPLPHVDHLLVERVRSGPKGYRADAGQLVIHSIAGGAVNQPWGLALAAHWRERLGEEPEVFSSNDAIVVQGGGDVPDELLADLLCPTGLVELLREALEDSGVFGARFRESAGRCLLIRKGRLGERLPLWMSRLASQRLLARIQRYPDFPVLLEAWRSCLDEVFDLERLGVLVSRLEDRSLRMGDVTTRSPSPFAAESGWRQINEYMYADDRPRTRRPSAVSTTLVETAARDARLRPTVAPAIVASFLQRRRRLEAGWGPVSALELRDWLHERRMLRCEEFTAQAERLESGALDAADWWRPLPKDERWLIDARDLARAERVFAPGATEVPKDRSAGEDDAARLEWLEAWLRFEGPVDLPTLESDWPGDAAQLRIDLATLVDDGTLVAGALVEGATVEQFCDADAHEAMLRMQRAARRPQLEALPAPRVPAFIARWHRLGAAEDVLDALEPLRALPLPAELWERALLPARTGRDSAAELDALLAAGDLVLTGASGDRRRDLCLVAADELDLLPRSPGAPEDLEVRLTEALPDPRARYDFDAFLAATGDAAAAAELLWQGLFAGRIAAESFETIRHGLSTGFTLPARSSPTDPAAGRHRGGLRARIRARVHGVPGRFRRLPPPEPANDEIDRLDLARRRARVLLDRWGVLCPALLQREARGLRWGDVFRALRLMELAGEVSAGHFLDGLDGPQFASPDAVAALRDFVAAPTPGPSCWLDARDPASPAGLGLDPCGLPAPARRAGAALVLDGGRVVLISERGGEALRLDPEADAATVERAFAALARILGAAGQGSIEVRRIDGAPARTAPALPALERCFTVSRDHRALVLRPRGAH
jgi:ATP-dependent Lhr-like helicase